MFVKRRIVLCGWVDGELKVISKTATAVKNVQMEPEQKKCV